MRRLLGRLDRWQRHHTPIAFLVAVARKFVDDRASRHAVRIAYYAFFSLFPLLLAFVSIVGFVLQDDPSRRDDILNSAYAEMPVVGPLVRGDIGTIGGSGVALAVGIGVALWAGLGVTLALGQALDATWNIAPVDQLGYVARRVRGLAMLATAGLALVASSVLSGAATSGHLDSEVWTATAALVLSLAVDAIALLAAFRLLASDRRRLGELVPGVIVATLGLLVLQTLGGWYVNTAIASASNTYGLFATVIGLLSWLSLASQLILIAAEVNAVAALRLWPRSLTGAPTAADTRAIEQYAESARRDPRVQVDVHWET
jgi:membrane protein